MSTRPSRSPACLILNGKSAMREDVRAAVRAIRAEGEQIQVRVTYEQGDGAQFAREAAASGFGLVIAGGGDGTVNEVASGMLEGSADSDNSPSLAILPLGTANDLAHACAIPLEPHAALRLGLSAEDAKVDIGRANGRVFVNLATGGFGTHVTVETRPELKKALGGAAYLLTGLTHFNSIRPDHGKFSGPGFSWEGAFLVLAVGNGRQAGGGHKLCPEALMNDGLLDIGILPTLPEREIPSEMHKLLHEGMRAVRSRVVSTRLARLEIETAEPLQVNLDGEPISGTRLVFEILPKRLSIRLPADCPLLG
jgi:lipid kinase YegS